LEEKCEDIKGVIGSHKSKKNRQHNDQKEKGQKDKQRSTKEIFNMHAGSVTLLSRDRLSYYNLTTTQARGLPLSAEQLSGVEHRQSLPVSSSTLHVIL